MSLLDINFYDEEANQGDSIWPFIGFWLFIAGVMLVLYGTVNLISAWRDFRIFYDSSAMEEKPDRELKKKQMKKYGIVIVVGVVLIIGTRFIQFA
ncbi:MAG: hypothetical protein PUF12_02735 [Thermoflexaceae bacterium]|nr:hypothetical protein [Thermoflexaceae bacterium]